MISKLKWLISSAFLILVVSTGTSFVYADGDSLYASGDYSGAISAYNAVLANATGKEQAPLLNNIGSCYVAIGDSDSAITYYQKAVTADPGYSRGYINLGVTFEKLGKPEDGLKSYDQVSTLDPALYAEAMVKKGTLLSGLGRQDEALLAFQEAESGAMDQVAVDLYTGIGAVKFVQKRSDEAEAAFLIATEIDPNGAAFAWTNLGVLYIAQGKVAEAKNAFETAIQHDPDGQTKAASYLQKLETMNKGKP